MPKGYEIVPVGEKWQLKCGATVLPEEYKTEIAAHIAALGKPRCGGDRPKQENTPATNPDNPDNPGDSVEKSKTSKLKR